LTLRQCNFRNLQLLGFKGLLLVGLFLVCAVDSLAQERFVTQSGGRGLINAKMEARMAKSESDIEAVEEELAKVQEHAKVEAPSCSDLGDKLRWTGVAWECDQEVDPTVLQFAKEALPNCSAGQVLRANGSSFSCGAAGFVSEELDPTVLPFAKKALPACGSAEVLSASADLTDFVCASAETGILAEGDPNVQGFARINNPLPNCNNGEVLRASNGRLLCVTDNEGGISVEVDPAVQDFARNENYSLTACADDHVVKASTIDGEVQLECIPDAGSAADALALDDLSDVSTAAQASNTVLMFNGTTWVAADELDPNTQAFARTAYTLAVCGTGEVLTTNADATQLVCAADAGGSGDPLNLEDLANVNVAGAVSGTFLIYNGSNWVPGVEVDPTVEGFAKAELPTCSAGEVLTGDGTSLSCAADAGGSGDPLSLSGLSDVTLAGQSNDQVLRFNGSAWVNSSDKIGALTATNWCRVVGADIVCDQGVPSVCTPPQVIQYNGTNGWTCADISGSVGDALNLDDLNDVTLSGLATGDRLFWNGSAWVNERKNYINAGDSQFVVADSGSGTAQIQVDGAPVLTAVDGQVGIGTTNPNAPLEVTGEISSTTLNVADNITAGGALNVTGAATTGPLTANGNSQINGDLVVTGNVLAQGDTTIEGVTFSQGGISATGQISATSFFGDGSQLTGVTADSIDWYDVTRVPSTVQDVSNVTPTDGILLVGDGSDSNK